MINHAELEAFVCQSQLIEGIGFDSANTKQHIKAAEYVLEEVKEGRWPDVREVHRILMLRSHLDMPGCFRTVAVYIRLNTKEFVTLPLANAVVGMMECWECTCEAVIFSEGGKKADNQLERLCLNQYYHFLSVHPFEDGNGRTGRLMYNALRSLVGLPWHTFTVDVHPQYVEALVEYEKEFRIRNIKSYDPG